MISLHGARERPLFDVAGAKWLLRQLWDSYGWFINLPESRILDALRDDWREDRRRLEYLARGAQPPPRQDALGGDVPMSAMAPLALGESTKGAVWAFRRPFAPGELALVLRSEGGLIRIKNDYLFARLLLELPECKGLLARCAHCGKYLLRKRARKGRSFCPGVADENASCRFAFHRAQSVKRPYAREWRKNPRVRARAQLQKAARAQRKVR